MSWFRREPREPRHFHEWKMIAAEVGTQGPSFMSTAITLVLRRCDCGETSTKVVDGHWTLNELNGRP